MDRHASIQIVYMPIEQFSVRSIFRNNPEETQISGESFSPFSTGGGDFVRVPPRMVYVDSSRPELVEGFTKKTFTAMIEGIREAAIDTRMIEPGEIDRGIKDLYRTTESDGVFCYTFFKAVAEKR